MNKTIQYVCILHSSIWPRDRWLRAFYFIIPILFFVFATMQMHIERKRGGFFARMQNRNCTFKYSALQERRTDRERKRAAAHTAYIILIIILFFCVMLLLLSPLVFVLFHRSNNLPFAIRRMNLLHNGRVSCCGGGSAVRH